MGSAAYGQTLLEASTKLPVDWTVPFPVLPPDPGGSALCPGHLRICPPTPSATDGYVDINLVGRFTLKGIPGLAVLAEAIPRQLRKRSFPVPAGLVDRCPPDCIPSKSVSASVSAEAKPLLRASSFARTSSPSSPPSPAHETSNAAKSRRASSGFSERWQVTVSRRASQLFASDMPSVNRPSIVVVADGAGSVTPSPAYDRC
jgi:hypothetical protein